MNVYTKNENMTSRKKNIFSKHEFIIFNKHQRTSEKMKNLHDAFLGALWVEGKGWLDGMKMNVVLQQYKVNIVGIKLS